MFLDEKPGDDFIEKLNPESLITLKNSVAEKSISEIEGACQFVRTGYFIPDSKDSNKDNLVFNRVLALKDSFSKKK